MWPFRKKPAAPPKPDTRELRIAALEKALPQRYRRDSFPRPCGLLSSRGKRGGRNLDYKGRPRRRAHKGVPGWRPSTVLSWLAQTGRLEA